MLEVLSLRSRLAPGYETTESSKTYDKTFEKSCEGDMTKLSLVFDQEIRC
jgi:hypothetical protein